MIGQIKGNKINSQNFFLEKAAQFWNNSCIQNGTYNLKLSFFQRVLK